MPTVSYNVGSSAGDARNINGDGTFNSTAVTQHIGKFSTTDYWNGFRWTGVAIPQGATITSAVLDLYSAQVTAGTTAKAIFYGENADNAVAFANTTANKPEGRSRTSASVSKNFTVATWTATLGFGAETVDVTTLVQEIVNRGGWVSGNAMVIVGHDNGSTNDNYIGHSTYDRATDRGASLTITYSTGEINASASDNVTISESVSLNIPGYSYSVNKSESVTVTESKTVAIASTGTLSINVSDTATITESVAASKTNLWTSNIGAWIYPGSPAQNADEEYTDGRQTHTLKPEYYTVNSTGVLVQLVDPADGENAYNSTNATEVKAYSHSQFFTISANAANMATLVGNATKRTNAINTIKSFLDTTGFTGVELDWEGYGTWTATHYSNYKIFVTSLGNTLHQYGYKLTLDGPPIGNVTEQGYYEWKYEDFNTLPVDYIVALAYDYEYDYGAGESIAPITWVQDICDWILTKITDVNRVVIGMSSYGYHGATGGFSITIDTKTQISAFTGYATATRNADYEMTWVNAGISYVYNDTTGINYKRSVIEAKGIKHISVWHLGGNDWFTGTEPIQPEMTQLVTVSESLTVSVDTATTRTINVSDSVSVSESLTKLVENYIAKSESVSVTENRIQVVESFITGTDSLTVSESLTRLLEGNISIEQFVNWSDSVSVAAIVAGSYSDNVTVSDSPSVAITLEINKSESITVSEAIHVMPVPDRSIAEVVTVSEAVTVRMDNFVLTVSDTATVTENKQADVTVSVNKTDTATVSESVNAATVQQLSVSDSASLTESLKAEVNAFIQKIDTITVTDTPTVAVQAGGADKNLTTSDSVTVSEGLGYYSETVFTRESYTVQIVDPNNENSSIAENITVNENTVVSIVSDVNVSDTATITESVALVREYSDTVADNVTVSESIKLEVESSVVKSDLITVLESVDSLIETDDRTVSVNEAVTLSESLKVELESAIDVSDTATITESFNFLQTPTGTIAELVSVDENLQLEVVSFVNKSDTATLSEALTVSRTSANTVLINITENVTVSEAVQGQPTVNISKSDSVTISELIRVAPSGVAINISVSATITVSESVRAHRVNAFKPHSKPLVIAVAPDGAYLHEAGTAVNLSPAVPVQTTLKSKPTNTAIKLNTSNDVYLK